jgi:hypothetical protein
MKLPITRRKFIQQCFYPTALLFSTGWLVSGCRSKNNAPAAEEKTAAGDPCTDFSGVGEKDLQAREKLGYVKESPLPASRCNNCNLYLPAPASQACGKCMLFKGPVYATAYCTYWAPQV